MIYINEGSFGCVFKPYFNCIFHGEDKMKPKYANSVGKVFDSDTEAIKEHKSNRIIEKLDPVNIFTPRYFGYCPAQYTDGHDDTISKCRKFSYNPKSIDKKPQLVYEYGGVDLSVGNDYLNMDMTLEEFMPLWLPILNGLQLLEKQDVVHQDIKPLNMLYNETTNKLNIIDFGLMEKMNKVFDFNNNYRRLQHDYCWYPPEYKLFYAINNRNYYDDDHFDFNTAEAEQYILDNFVYFGPVKGRLFTKTDYRNHLDDYVDELFGKNKDKYNITSMPSPIDLQKHFEINSNKIDIYSIGISLVQCLSPQYSNIGSRFNGIQTKINDVYRFIDNLVHPNPNLRYSASKAHSELKKLCLKHKFIKSDSPVAIARRPKLTPVKAADIKKVAIVDADGKPALPVVDIKLEDVADEASCKDKFTVKQLKDFCFKNKLSRGGAKKDLCKRIKKFLEKQKIQREEFNAEKALLEYYEFIESGKECYEMFPHQASTIARNLGIKPASLCRDIEKYIEKKTYQINVPKCLKGESTKKEIEVIRVVGKKHGIKKKLTEEICSELDKKQTNCKRLNRDLKPNSTE